MTGEVSLINNAGSYLSTEAMPATTDTSWWRDLAGAMVVACLRGSQLRALTIDPAAPSPDRT